MRKIKLPLLAASISFAVAFTLSCSGDDGDGGGYFVESYPVVAITSDYIIVKETYTDYECKATGLEMETNEYTNRFYYSIENKVLTLDFYDNYVKFNGKTDTIIGTWTRNKNKAEHCRDHYYYDEYEGYWCDEYYDVTKLDISAQTVKVTRDFCFTDEMKIGEDFWHNGYKITNIDGCSNMTLSKGGNSIKISISESAMRYTYNGKSCEQKEESKDERTRACNKAISDCSGNSYRYCIEEAYYDYLDMPLYECFRTNFPSDFLPSSEFLGKI